MYELFDCAVSPMAFAAQLFMSILNEENVMKSLMLLLILPLSFAAVAADAPEKASMRTKAGLYVDARESYKMLTEDSGREVVLIDVRDPVEIMFTGYTNETDIHLPWKIIDTNHWDEKKQSYGGHINPRFGEEMTARLNALGIDKQAHLIFMCRSGSTRSAPAADELYDLGYKNVYSMVDGLKNVVLPWGWTMEKDVMYGLES